MGLKYLKRFNQVKLSGICSCYDPGTRAKACANGAIKAFPPIDNLSVCDGYVVAVPIPNLTKVCTSLLKFKKHIFSEKTLCLSFDNFGLLKKSGGAEYIFVMHK
jgi:hypothetical protein